MLINPPQHKDKSLLGHTQHMWKRLTSFSHSKLKEPKNDMIIKINQPISQARTQEIKFSKEGLV